MARVPRPARFALLALALTLLGCTRDDPVAALRQLTLDAIGDGAVTVNGLALALPFSQALLVGQEVRIEAVPAEAQRFVGWEGDLNGGGNPVRLRMRDDLAATARFEPLPSEQTLVLAYDGGGGGRVWSDPWGLDCQRPCAGSFAAGSEVTLQALPDPASFLRGWGNCDAFDGDACRVRVASDRTVWALFAPIDAYAPNDAFAERVPLAGAAGVARATNARATTESGEPRHATDASGRSLWWSWTAPFTGRTTFDVRASGVPATVALYRGASLAQLRPVAGTGPVGAFTFDALAGQTYQVAVDGLGSAAGFVRLAWSGASDVVWRAEPATLRLSGVRGAGPPAPGDLLLRNEGTAAARFELASDAPWLRTEPSEGALAAGEARSIRVAADACDGSGIETATVTIAGGGATSAATVERACSGAAWRASPPELTILPEPGGAAPSAQLTLHNDGDTAALQVSGDAAWLHVTPAQASLDQGDALVLEVRADACQGSEQRLGTLLVSGGGHDLTVPVSLRCRSDGATLVIERVVVNQAVPAADSAQAASQRLPVVAGRAGLLRVFVRATEAGVADAVATLRYRTPGAPERTLMLRGPSEVPTATDEGSLELDFQALLPAEALQVDFEASVEVRAASDARTLFARFPASGWWRPEVEVAAALPVTLVPISLNGGPVPIVGDPDAYLDLTRRTFPLADDAIDVRLRAPVTFNGNLTTRGEWSRMLRRLIDVHATDAVARYYVGLVTPPRSGLFGGIARTGQPREGGFVPVAIATASLTTGPWIVAHELGHVWGRRHAPCGTPDPDPNYPFPGGGIGVWGFDRAEGRLLHPEDAPDLMGYCRQDAWISDYTYAGVLEYRRTFARFPEPPPGEAQRVAIVSGEITHAGGVTLDPVIELERRAAPAMGGPYRVAVWDETGRTLAEARFDTFDTSLHDGEQFHVTLALAADGGDLAGVRIDRDGIVLVERTSGVRPLHAPAPTRAERAADGSVVVHWDAGAYAELLVLDGATGGILGSDTTGTLRVWPEGARLVAVLSDGVRTERHELWP